MEDASFGWKDWCESQDFRINRLEMSFRFTLAPHANVLQINSSDDLIELPKVEMSSINGKELPRSLFSWVLLDFEKLVAEGDDVIQVNMSDDRATTGKWGDGLYHLLYGWDCDSILVMNKDVIVI